MITFETTTFEDCLFGRGKPLAEAAYGEVDAPRYRTPSSFYRLAYRRIDADMESFAVLALDDGKPVGMVGIFVDWAAHSFFRYAYNDFIYVKPEYRETNLGGRLLHLAESTAKEEGVHKFMWDIPQDSALDKALAKRSGTYRPCSVTYLRDL